MANSFSHVVVVIFVFQHRSALFLRKSMMYQKAIKAASKEYRVYPHQPTLTPKISPDEYRPFFDNCYLTFYEDIL